MPILGKVGRNHPSQIALRVGIYGLLTLGSICIIYPLLIVLGQTFSDQFDLRDNAIIPRYLLDRNELELKHIFAMQPQKLDLLASRHNRNQWTSQVNMRDDRDFYATRPEVFAEQGFSLDAHRQIVADLDEFKKTLDSDTMFVCVFRAEDYYRPFLRKRYGANADAVRKEFEKTGQWPAWVEHIYPGERERKHILSNRDRLGLAIMNHDFQSDYMTYHGVELLPPGNFTVPFWRPGRTNKDLMWREFKRSLPPESKLIISSDTYWHTFLKLKYPKIGLLNDAWGTSHVGFYGLKCPLAPPDDPTLRADWEEFIVKRWPRRLLRIPADYAPQWRDHVRQRLAAKVGKEKALGEAGKLMGRKLARWDDLPLPTRLPKDETLGRYWCEFTSTGTIPAERMVLDAPELGFRRFLREKYGDLAALNKAWKASFGSFDDVPLPLGLYDDAPIRFHPTRVRLSHMTESFERVFEYLTGRGRAIQNTFILVFFSLLSALTINPIAAYSLSRFPMRHTQKILIFFLATMAFPAEVAMIPNFLLLRDLGLLNTYTALIFPGMANGFAIFLLKGFFDSLPQELYEAAEIDGASELQVFRLVAMPLIAPILAYIGLTTFVIAYSSFMWAFVICPKQEMWTLMVWVYDFQMQNPGNNYIMAATALVSIPPMIVFLFANRIIMRGIVIPSMK
ncbi:MAG: ABC transporter permease subunit [Planctomycetes bacterium]|nr:ABC transporter permease subunit [Planctomycetota bacterium]